MVFAPLFDLTADDGDADEVGIGGDGFGVDSTCVVTERVCDIAGIR